MQCTALYEAATTCTKSSHRGQVRCTVSASRSAAAAQSMSWPPSPQRAPCGSLKRSAPKTFHSCRKKETSVCVLQAQAPHSAKCKTRMERVYASNDGIGRPCRNDWREPPTPRVRQTPVRARCARGLSGLARWTIQVGAYRAARGSLHSLHVEPAARVHRVNVRLSRRPNLARRSWMGQGSPGRYRQTVAGAAR